LRLRRWDGVDEHRGGDGGEKPREVRLAEVHYRATFSLCQGDVQLERMGLAQLDLSFSTRLDSSFLGTVNP
jgi:hypothetical protein